MVHKYPKSIVCPKRQKNIFKYSNEIFLIFNWCSKIFNSPISHKRTPNGLILMIPAESGEYHASGVTGPCEGESIRRCEQLRE